MKKNTLTALFLFLLYFAANAEGKDKPAGFMPGPVEVAEVTSIYDGDTFRVNIEGWPDVAGQRVPVRVKGLDTPELRGECEQEKILARVAKKFTVEKLRSAKKIELLNIERGKYFRLLAEVRVDGQDLTRMLIEGGFARPYDGRYKLGWCDPLPGKTE